MSPALRAVLLVLLLAGCAARGALAPLPPEAEGGTQHTIFVGSTRATDPLTGQFNSGRALEPTFGRYRVWVPPDRESGEIGLPRRGRISDPQEHFLTAGAAHYRGNGGFRSELAAALRSEPGEGEVVLYLHGFNSTFAEGLYRTAQLTNDLDIPGIPVLYSWPSLGSPLGYAYDRDSALFARNGLRQLLHEIEAAGAARIIVVAHSMGAQLFMEGLRDLAIAGETSTIERIGGIILLSPDIDVDVFRAQARRVGRLPQPFVIFTSQRDRVLQISGQLSRQSVRLGTIEDLAPLADLDVTVLETGALSAGGLGHFSAAYSPALLQILRRITDVDSGFVSDQRAGIDPVQGTVLSVQNATRIILSPVTAFADEIGR